MHKIWELDDPHARFLHALHQQKAKQIMGDKTYLAMMRFDNDLFTRTLKRFGEYFSAMGLDLFQEVYKASEGEQHKSREQACKKKAAPPDRFPKPSALSVHELLLRRAFPQLPSEIVETILLFHDSAPPPEDIHVPVGVNGNG